MERLLSQTNYKRAMGQFYQTSQMGSHHGNTFGLTTADVASNKSGISPNVGRNTNMYQSQMAPDYDNEVRNGLAKVNDKVRRGFENSMVMKDQKIKKVQD